MILKMKMTMMKTHLNQVILTLVPLILTLMPMEYFQMRNLQIDLKRPNLFASFSTRQ